MRQSYQVVETKQSAYGRFISTCDVHYSTNQLL